MTLLCLEGGSEVAVEVFWPDEHDIEPLFAFAEALRKLDHLALVAEFEWT